MPERHLRLPATAASMKMDPNLDISVFSSFSNGPAGTKSPATRKWKDIVIPYPLAFVNHK
jgi:hypothetical protein